MDDSQNRVIGLNAKSLNNSLGTANKKSLNMSNPGIVDSTLNDGQFHTMAKTGMMNNLNLS